MNTILLTAGAAQTGSTAGFLTMIIVWVVVLGLMMYFMTYRPQKKEQARMKELFDNLAVGDSVLTTSGMYGVVIDIMPEIVVIEFGSNKNCRIPMKKTAIVNVEKSEKPGTIESANNQAVKTADDSDKKNK